MTRMNLKSTSKWTIEVRMCTYVLIGGRAGHLPPNKANMAGMIHVMMNPCVSPGTQSQDNSSYNTTRVAC